MYLTAKGTVDEKVLQALQNKADLARTLVDDYRHGFNPFAEADAAALKKYQDEAAAALREERQKTDG